MEHLSCEQEQKHNTTSEIVKRIVIVSRKYQYGMTALINIFFILPFTAPIRKLDCHRPPLHGGVKGNECLNLCIVPESF